MKLCDDSSRLVDKSTYSAHPYLFWEANDTAIRLWGRDFTYDRFGSSSQVQPMGCVWKLPFSSRYVTAVSNGTDALSQHWHGHINCVDAPFGLIDKILAVLRSQSCGSHRRVKKLAGNEASVGARGAVMERGGNTPMGSTA